VVFISGELPRYGLSLQCLQALKVPGGSMLAWQMGVMVTRSLQSAFTQVLANPAMQWLWLMGDDHTYQADTVLRLLDLEEPVVGGLVLNRAPPFNTTVHVHEQGGGRVKLLPEIPTRGLYTLAANESCGDAGLLIRREVLEAMGPRGWFDHWTSGALSAEDQQFTAKLGKVGHPVKIDVETHIGHMTPFDVQPVVKDGRWEVRLMCGNHHVCDMAYPAEARARPLPAPVTAEAMPAAAPKPLPAELYAAASAAMGVAAE
jgi:hypothetical protein